MERLDFNLLYYSKMGKLMKKLQDAWEIVQRVKQKYQARARTPIYIIILPIMLHRHTT